MSRLGSWYASLSRREQRIVAGGLLLVLCYVAFQYMLVPLLDWRDALILDIQENRRILSRYEEILRSRELYASKARRAEQLEDRMDQRLLPGTKPELASAELQTVLKSLARKYDIGVERITPREARELPPYIEITIEAPFYCSASQLRRFLYDIETADRFLYIQKLEIRVPNTKKPERIRVSIQASGFIRVAQEAPVEGEEEV